MATKYECDVCKEIFPYETDVKGMAKIDTAIDCLAQKPDGVVIELLITRNHNTGGMYEQVDCCPQCKLHLMKNAIKLNQSK